MANADWSFDSQGQILHASGDPSRVIAEYRKINEFENSNRQGWLPKERPHDNTPQGRSQGAHGRHSSHHDVVPHEDSEGESDPDLVPLAVLGSPSDRALRQRRYTDGPWLRNVREIARHADVPDSESMADTISIAEYKAKSRDVWPVDHQNPYVNLDLQIHWQIFPTIEVGTIRRKQQYSQDVLDLAIERWFVGGYTYLQPGILMPHQLRDRAKTDWSDNAHGIYYRHYQSRDWEAEGHKLWIPSSHPTSQQTVSERAQILAQHAAENESSSKREFAWKADAWRDVFDKMRDDPLIILDNHEYYTLRQDCQPVSCLLQGQPKLKRDAPDITFGLATTRGTERSQDNEDPLDSQRLQALSLIKETALLSDPRWGDNDLVFPFAVYEAKGWSGKANAARQEACTAAAVYLDMLDNLAKKPGSTKGTESGGYQTLASHDSQVFALTSHGAHWHVMVGYKRPRLPREFAGRRGMSEHVYLFQRIWSGRIVVPQKAEELLNIIDQIHEWGITTHRDFVTQHLKAWHAASKGAYARAAAALLESGGQADGRRRRGALDLPEWTNHVAKDTRPKLEAAYVTFCREARAATGLHMAVAARSSVSGSSRPSTSTTAPEESAVETSIDTSPSTTVTLRKTNVGSATVVAGTFESQSTFVSQSELTRRLRHTMVGSTVRADTGSISQLPVCEPVSMPVDEHLTDEELEEPLQRFQDFLQDIMRADSGDDDVLDAEKDKIMLSREDDEVSDASTSPSTVREQPRSMFDDSLDGEDGGTVQMRDDGHPTLGRSREQAASIGAAPEPVAATQPTRRDKGKGKAAELSATPRLHSTQYDNHDDRSRENSPLIPWSLRIPAVETHMDSAMIGGSTDTRLTGPSEPTSTRKRKRTNRNKNEHRPVGDHPGIAPGPLMIAATPLRRNHSRGTSTAGQAKITNWYQFTPRDDSTKKSGMGDRRQDDSVAQLPDTSTGISTASDRAAASRVVADKNLMTSADAALIGADIHHPISLGGDDDDDEDGLADVHLSKESPYVPTATTSTTTSIPTRTTSNSPTHKGKAPTPALAISTSPIPLPTVPPTLLHLNPNSTPARARAPARAPTPTSPTPREVTPLSSASTTTTCSIPATHAVPTMTTTPTPAPRSRRDGAVGGVPGTSPHLRRAMLAPRLGRGVVVAARRGGGGSLSAALRGRASGILPLARDRDTSPPVAVSDNLLSPSPVRVSIFDLISAPAPSLDLVPSTTTTKEQLPTTTTPTSTTTPTPTPIQPPHPSTNSNSNSNSNSPTTSQVIQNLQYYNPTRSAKSKAEQQQRAQQELQRRLGVPAPREEDWDSDYNPPAKKGGGGGGGSGGMRMKKKTRR